MVNTIVPIFNAQNLLHVLKKEKARIKLMNFSQKYMGLFFFWGGYPVLRSKNDLFSSSMGK